MNLKKTLKKLYKSGYFNGFELTKNSLTYFDCYGNMYVIHCRGKFPYMRIGHVWTGKKYALTYQSEYNVYDWISISEFIDHVKPVQTNNPDFVLRASVGYLNN